MAIYHLSAKVITRGAGHSAVHAAAYRARADLTDERTGLKHDYSRKSGDVLFSDIYAPKDAPKWAHDRAQLWNHVEVFEKHRRAELAREYEIALFPELTLEQNRQALQDLVRESFTRRGLIADVNIHAPSKDGDQRNIHAHVMVVTRKLDGSEFVRTKERFEKFSEKEAAKKAELEKLRVNWERIGNRHLERHGHQPTLDHRSLQAQGIDRAPTIHQGKAATALERKGKASELGTVNREIAAANTRVIDLAAERERRQERAQTRDRDEGTDRPEKSQTASHGPENGPSAELERRDAERAAWIAERKAEREQRRPASWIEQRIADNARLARLYSAPIVVDRDGQRVTGADVLADRMKPEGERELRMARARSYAEAFSARLDDAGMALVRVTADDAQAIAKLREAAEREGPTRRTATGSLRGNILANVQAGDLVAVTKSGDVYRINAEKLGGAVLPENLPSVIEARAAFKTDRERTDALHQQRNSEQLVKREAMAEAHEKRAAVIDRAKEVSAGDVASKGFGIGGKALGAITVGALKFLDGLFSSPKKRTVEEIKNDIRTLNERREIAAERAAIRENETRRGEEIERKDEEQSQHLTAPHYFRPITRPINRDRDRDRDEGYERERER